MVRRSRVLGRLRLRRRNGSPTTIDPGDMPENTIEDNEVLTVTQVSKLLQLHPRTIYKLAQTGMIPARRVGKSWRFLKSEIMKWFEKRDV